MRHFTGLDGDDRTGEQASLTTTLHRENLNKK